MNREFGRNLIKNEDKQSRLFFYPAMTKVTNNDKQCKMADMFRTTSSKLQRVHDNTYGYFSC